jgi:hypothetical protein
MTGEAHGTEVATRDQVAGDVSRQFEGASEPIVTFLVDLQVAYAIAQRLVSTSFVPQSYQNKPQEAAAAIVAGQGIGLGPMEALRSIDIIQGTPAIRAIAMRALVVGNGHEMWVEEQTPTRAVVAGKRQGSDKVQRSEWDLDRARGLNLLGKDNWKKQPSAMLVARATSECARLIAPDALLGIPYSSEELQDSDDFQSAPERAPRRSAGISTVASRARAAASAEATTPDVPVVAAESPTQPDVDGSAAEVEMFPCARCGKPEAPEEGAICATCEDQIEAEIAAVKAEEGRA